MELHYASSERFATIVWNADQYRFVAFSQDQAAQSQSSGPTPLVTLEGLEGRFPDALVTLSPEIARASAAAASNSRYRLSEPVGSGWFELHEGSPGPRTQAAIRVASSREVAARADYLSLRVAPSHRGDVEWTAGYRSFGDFSRMEAGVGLKIQVSDSIAGSGTYFLAPSGDAYSADDLLSGVRSVFGHVPAEVTLVRDSGVGLVVAEAQFDLRHSEYEELTLWCPNDAGDVSTCNTDRERAITSKHPSALPLDDVIEALTPSRLQQLVRLHEASGPSRPLGHDF